MLGEIGWQLLGEVLAMLWRIALAFGFGVIGAGGFVSGVMAFRLVLADEVRKIAAPSSENATSCEPTEPGVSGGPGCESSEQLSEDIGAPLDSYVFGLN